MVVRQSILVVTSTPGFGELIQETLEETGVYRVLLVDSTLEALTCTQNIPFSLAILDFELNEQGVFDFALSLKSIQENTHLIAIPPENNPSHPLLARLPVEGFLFKPFYLPDLLELVTGVLDGQVEPISQIPEVAEKPRGYLVSHADDSSTATWLQDVNRAAQHLTRLTLESSAQAALIVRQGELWAYAGQLDQPTAYELAKAVSLLSGNNALTAGRITANTSDIVRIVRLETTGREYLVYITFLAGEVVLAMAFDAETPLSTIRTQANSLARALEGQAEIQPHLTASLVYSQTSASDAFKPANRPLAFAEEDGMDEQAYEEEDDGSPITFPSVFGDVLPPIPHKSVHASPKSDNQTGSSPDQSIDLFEEADLLTPEAQGEVDGQLRPLTPTLHSLYYFCLLIPRLPNHHLVDKISHILTDAITQLCLAYSWRLEHLSIRPDHCQWIVNLSPYTSPSTLMRILRQKTSKRIFNALPDLRLDNPSGDFWAPGYLIMSGSRLPKARIIKDYILRTRRYQGLSSSTNTKV